MRRPVVAMHHVLQSQVTSEKHRFLSVEADIAVKQKTVNVPSDMFEPRPSDRSVPFDELVSSKATVDHYSPQAAQNCCNTADHQMKADAWDKFGDYSKVAEAWQGCVLDSAHHVIIKHRLNAADPFKFYYPLLHFPDSSVLVWPIYSGAPPGFPSD